MILAVAPVTTLFALQETLQQFIDSLPQGVHPAEVVIDVEPDTVVRLLEVRLMDGSAVHNVEFSD